MKKKFRKEGIKITIGVFPDLSIKEARKIARELKRLMAKGIDPREAKRQKQIAEDEKRLKARQEITFQELYYKYIEEYAKIYTIHWQKDAARIYIYWQPRIYNYGKLLFLKKISDIKSNDIEQIFNDISKGGKYATANLLLATLRTIFNKAIK
ncbi:Arm DNA-binding domain-containing protein [Orientia tsutsugamushi]|uniref:Arm DNA-binding domain-containing protein n=1 Tax=Orientia tsutsugamushi TaxID=784 RepID=UPI00315DC802